MKFLYLILTSTLLLLALSCNKTTNEKTLESLDLIYDSLLVDSVVNINHDFKVAKLIDWEIDTKATQENENMLYLNNINHYGMITIKAYADGNFPNYLQETLKTFEGHTLVSESNFTYSNKTYHQYILKSEGFIIQKNIIEINNTNYLDTNILVVESKYSELKPMIETYLASIADLN